MEGGPPLGMPGDAGGQTGDGPAALSGDPSLGVSDLSSFATLPAGIGLLTGVGVPPGDFGGAGVLAPIAGMPGMLPGAPVVGLGGAVGGAPAFGAGSAAPGPSSALSMMAEQLQNNLRKLEAMEGAEARAQRVVEQRSAADGQRRRREPHVD